MNKLIVTAQITALASFALGTSLFSFYLYFKRPYQMETIGIMFIVLAIIINSILFLILLIASLLYANDRFELLKTCGIMLLNIPVGIFYFYLVLTLGNPNNF